MSTGGESGIIEAKDERTGVPVDEKMLIDAIRQVVQEEIRAETAGLRAEMAGLQIEMADVMDTKLDGLKVEMADVMDAKLDGLKVEMADVMDAKLDGLKVEMSDLMDAKLTVNNKALKAEIMDGFHIVIEDKVSKEIRLIAEQHDSLVRKQQELERVDERTADLEDRVQVIEVVVRKHTGEIQELQRA